MSNRHWPVTLLILAFLMLVQLMGCSGTDTDDPRKTVIALFGAMEKNDQARIAYLINLPELMKTSDHDYALAGGEARVFTDPQQILDDLTGDGQTKTTVLPAANCQQSSDYRRNSFRGSNLC